ncbi:MAG: apolipoprotein N-acyltransferase [Actinomyces sp.]|nr:MAG: apolipoprotein N-acyltransferase [Actinomyces sp.]
MAGLAGWYLLMAHPSARVRFRRSAVAAAAWLVPATVWMLDFSLPGWIVASAVYATGYGLVGALCPPDPARRAPAFPALFVVAEALRWNVPFGGVPLATLAMAEVASPLAPATRLLGSPGLSALTVVAGVAVAEAVAGRRRPATVAALVVAAGVAGGALVPRAEVVGTLDVAVVQGGGPQRTRADVCTERAVFERHLAASALIEGPVDLVVWPENVVNPTPDTIPTPRRCDAPLLRHDEAATTLAELARELDAVVVAGWFERAPSDDANVNYVTVVTPDGDTVDRYDKVRLVPFGEFVPLRSLIEAFSGELPARDTRPGEGPAVVVAPLDPGDGVRPVPLGVSISWEVFFDHRSRDSVRHGAEILLNPTNGSSYWLTIVQTQQVASSRLRALETDRWVLQAAPTGLSAVVDPAGRVRARTGVGEQAVLRATVELRRGTTPAVRWGLWPVLGTALVVLAALAAPAIRRRARSSGPPRAVGGA